MQITALIQVINYLKEVAENSVLLSNYKELSVLVKEAGVNKEKNYQAILKKKEQVEQFLIDTDPVGWSFESYNFFLILNNNQLFGKKAAEHLESLIKDENADFKKAHTAIEKKITLISKMADSLNKFQQLFEQLIPAEAFKLAADPGKKSSVRIYFDKQLVVQNISDLERYSRLWDNILRTFTRLDGGENLTLDISSFQDGIFVLGVAIEEKTLDIFIKGVAGILKTMPLMLNIRKIQLEMNRLPLVYDFTDLLEEEINMLVNQIASETVNNIINGQSDDEESVKNLSRSLKQILSFVEKGGRIECYSPKPAKEIAELNKSINEFSNLAVQLEELTKEVKESFREDRLPVHEV